jgi:hypothetical protein
MENKEEWDLNCKGSPEFAANIIWELSKKKKEPTPSQTSTRLLQKAATSFKAFFKSRHVNEKLQGVNADVEYEYFIRLYYDGELVDFCRG